MNDIQPTASHIESFSQSYYLRVFKNLQMARALYAEFFPDVWDCSQNKVVVLEFRLIDGQLRVRQS